MSMSTREQWGTRAGFVLAAIGSAIGLGNIWRYPYVLYENGGGSFLIPYFFALFTTGIPILLLEFWIGHRYRKAAPYALRDLARGWSWLGWWPAMVCFVIVTYYAVVLAWALSYMYFSFGLQWGDDTKAFLFGNFLKLTDSPSVVGGLQWHIVLPVVIVWAIVFFYVYRGVRKGIERANKVMIPLLLVMIAIVVFRGVTLPGAMDGLNHLLTPDFSTLANPQVWIAAYSQVFFSLSIAFGVMITYASYLPKRADINNSAFITGLANSGFEFFAALGVFGAIGFLAHVQGADVKDVASAGPGLAFVVFPKIISELPALNELFGVLFFGALVLAGLTSAISLVEVSIAAVMEKFSWSRQKAASIVCGAAFVGSLVYTTGGGLYYLDIVDHFINAFGGLLVGLLEVILVGWVVKKTAEARAYTNTMSDFAIGSWWDFCVRYVTPIVLGAMTLLNLVKEFREPYEGYPLWALLTLGAGVAAAALIVSVAFHLSDARNLKPVSHGKQEGM